MLPTKSYQSKERAYTVGNSIHALSSETSISTNTVSSFVSNPSSIKISLESVLFPERLSFNAVTHSMKSIGKESCSPLGEILCEKTPNITTVVTQQVSTCLFDRSLYERLTRLVALLLK